MYGYGRWKEEDDCRDNSIYHYRSQCLPRLISIAVMWIVVNILDV